MSRIYLNLSKQIFSINEFKIIPIRDQDKYLIMKWRNEQIYHLRQTEELTKERQKFYFNKVISNLFQIKYPNQLLFSFLKNDKCIGYGGLVHISWENKNAEISFIMKTSLEKKYFGEYWSIFLSLIEELSFKELSFNKIFTYAFDLRPNLYKTLEQSGYKLEGKLKNHIFFNNKFVDVVIHAKYNKNIT